MAIFVAGDTHGTLDVEKLSTLKGQITADDYILVIQGKTFFAMGGAASHDCGWILEKYWSDIIKMQRANTSKSDRIKEEQDGVSCENTIKNLKKPVPHFGPF